jgi:hypothetical protein
MAGKSRKPAPPAAVPGARALIDDDSGSVAAPPKQTETPVPQPARRKRRARFVF